MKLIKRSMLKMWNELVRDAGRLLRVIVLSEK